MYEVIYNTIGVISNVLIIVWHTYRLKKKPSNLLQLARILNIIALVLFTYSLVQSIKGVIS